MSGNLKNFTWNGFLEATRHPNELIGKVLTRSYTDEDTDAITSMSAIFNDSIRFTFERRYGRCATFKVPEEQVKRGIR